MELDFRARRRLAQAHELSPSIASGVSFTAMLFDEECGSAHSHQKTVSGQPLSARPSDQS
jgi:hypothetical protein